jgi:TRAP transporter TAXI family solute receptor
MNSATRRTILGWGLVLATLAGLVATAAAQERVSVKILTTSQGTTTHAILGALAASLSKHVPGYTATAATVTPASAITQLKDVGRGVADLSSCGIGLALDAVRGQGAFRDGALNLRVLAVLYPNRMQLVTFEGSGITKLADLKGKRVSTGTAAGATEVSVTRVFEAAGMDIDRDIRRERLVLADAVKAFQEGRIDAFFEFGNRVLSPILRDPVAFPGKKIKLIDTAEVAEAINRKYGPIFAKGAVPAGTYVGQDAAVPTLEAWTLLCAGQTVSDQVAYNVVKTLFEQKADLVAAHPDAADIALAKQAEVKPPISFHPGALKYFAEKGIRVGN